MRRRGASRSENGKITELQREIDQVHCNMTETQSQLKQNSTENARIKSEIEEKLQYKVSNGAEVKEVIKECELFIRFYWRHELAKYPNEVVFSSDSEDDGKKNKKKKDNASAKEPKVARQDSLVDTPKKSLASAPTLGRLRGAAVAKVVQRDLLEVEKKDGKKRKSKSLIAKEKERNAIRNNQERLRVKNNEEIEVHQFFEKLENLFQPIVVEKVKETGEPAANQTKEVVDIRPFREALSEWKGKHPEVVDEFDRKYPKIRSKRVLELNLPEPRLLVQGPEDKNRAQSARVSRSEAHADNGSSDGSKSARSSQRSRSKSGSSGSLRREVARLKALVKKHELTIKTLNGVQDGSRDLLEEAGDSVESLKAMNQSLQKQLAEQQRQAAEREKAHAEEIQRLRAELEEARREPDAALSAAADDRDPAPATPPRVGSRKEDMRFALGKSPHGRMKGARGASKQAKSEEENGGHLSRLAAARNFWARQESKNKAIG